MQVVTVILVLGAMLVKGQRPSFAGTRPIGYPELANRTTTEAGIVDKFGEDITTQRLPIEANGDRDLIDRLSKLPIDKQPFWFINWQALEAHRQKPQTYPIRPNPFIEPLQPVNQGTKPSTNNNIKTELPSINENPIADKVTDNTEDRFGMELPEVTKKPIIETSSDTIDDNNNFQNDEKIIPDEILSPEQSSKKPVTNVQDTNLKTINNNSKDDVETRDIITTDKVDVAIATNKPHTVPETYFKSSTNIPEAKNVLNKNKIVLDQTSYLPAVSVTLKPELSYIETYYKGVKESNYKVVDITKDVAESINKPALTYLEKYFKARLND